MGKTWKYRPRLGFQVNEVTTAFRSSASCNISCWCTVAGATEGLCLHMAFGKVAAFIRIFDNKNHVIPPHCFLKGKKLNRKMLLTVRDCIITASTPHVCRIAILANYMPLSCRFGGQSVPVKAFNTMLVLDLATPIFHGNQLRLSPRRKLTYQCYFLVLL